MIFSKNMRARLRLFYHWLPVSQRVKWRLREQFLPLLAALQADHSLRGIARGLTSVIRHTKSGLAPLRDDGCERALARMLGAMAEHARVHGPVRHWIALPFLSTGGAEMVAINLFRALREIRPGNSGLLLITDRKLVSDRMVMPVGVLTLVLDDYLIDDLRYARKQALLRDLLVAARPDCFHNINSEVAWNLILEEGERLRRFTNLFASIFAFQFAPDGHTKTGYAAYFLKKGMPHLSGLLSDNQRFVDDAALEFQLTLQEQSRMAVLYQPCRLLTSDASDVGRQRLARFQAMLAAGQPLAERRPQILWAGRLDAEKRIDLFLDVVRRCTFADFRVFGQVVLGDGEILPVLPNLSYEGPFSSPLEWLERFDFDAFIFTSRWEGMPNILIEVGALGIPVIAATVGGVGELITESTGYPLPERPTVTDYEQALRCVVDNPTQALQRAGHLYELVLQRHSWDHFVSRIAAVPDYFGSALPSQAISEADSDAVVMRLAGARAQPLVSVIVPCYNQGRYLQESVASALMACRHPMEIIVVDDGSTDGNTRRYLSEAEQLAPGIVRIHRQVNCGLSGARNNGIALARGQYVQFLDADDLLAPGKIDAQVAQLQVNPALAVSVCNYLLCDDARAQFSKLEEAIARFDLTEQDFLYRWERGFAIPIHCGLFRRRLLGQIQFDTSARAKEDWMFWTSLAMAGTRFGYIHGHWAIYRQHADSMRRSYVGMGRAWLQAGLKIDTMLAGREPLFFESVVSWFNQCYRSHPSYRTEIAQRQSTLKADLALTVVPPALGTGADVMAEVKLVADAILKALAMLPNAEQPPLISVVVPIYGHFNFLQGCLESLALQGDVSIEVVCIDDGSPDPRVPLLMQALQGKNSRLVAHLEATNQGISAVQNAAVNMASGEYVAFLDCDDALEPGALKAVQTALEENPQVDYLFTDRVDVDETGNTVRVARYGGYDNLQFSQQGNIGADLLDGMVASHLKVIRRSVYEAVGGCNAMFSGVQDWELALRIAQEHKLHYLAKPMYRHRIHNGSVTSSESVAQLRKTNQVRRLYLERQRSPYANVRQIRVFRVQEMPLLLVELKTAWERGEFCVADASGSVNLGQINFLREFNSYFEQIYWSDPKVPTSLFGYLCNDVELCNNDSGNPP
jgi:glycosyltransferase involved in cell wall biosynthesis